MNVKLPSIHLPHLSIGDVIVFKILLSLSFIAVFFIPHPYNMPVGMASNLVWLWRL